MGLRQRKSLTQCQTNQGEEPQSTSSSQLSKTSPSKAERLGTASAASARTRPARSKASKSPRSRSKTSQLNATIKLAATVNPLDQFLDPACDFEAPIAPSTPQSASTPSRVDVAVKTLGKLESEVINALFPPCGAPPATLEEVSQDLGMTVAEVQNIADEALRGLRGLRNGTQRISKAWN